MKLLIQRVLKASCTIESKVVSSIGNGYCVFVGFENGDTKEIVEKLVNKLVKLRIFSDADGKMNKSIEEVNGSVLSISQFTLYASCKKGNRPSFIQAAKPDLSMPLYEYFNDQLAKYLPVETGEFGADMLISIENDGPVTIMMDSKEIL